MGYLICEKCKGYYALQDGESAKDFESCECGGKLIYSEFLKDTNKNVEHLETPNICASCGKENLAESKFCENCGLPLKAVQIDDTSDDPKSQNNGLKSKKFSNIILRVIAVAFGSLIMLIPYILSSNEALSTDFIYISLMLWLIGGFASALIYGGKIRSGALNGFLSALVSGLIIMVVYGGDIAVITLIPAIFSVIGGVIGIYVRNINKLLKFWNKQSRGRKITITFVSICIIGFLLYFTNGGFTSTQHYDGNDVSFNYVTGWNITNGDGNLGKIVTGTYDFNGPITFSVFKSHNSGLSLDDSKNAWEKNITSDGAKIKSSSIITVDGNKAYAIDYSFTKNNSEMQNYAVIFVKNSSNYVLLFTTESNLHSYRRSINTIIDSFHVK